MVKKFLTLSESCFLSRAEAQHPRTVPSLEQGVGGTHVSPETPSALTF